MNYFKKGLLRGLLGIPIAVFIGTTFTLIITEIYGITTVVNISYLLLPYIEECIFGYVFLSISIVFSVESWSRLKQFVVYFIALMIIFLPTFIIGSKIPVALMSTSINGIMVSTESIIPWASIILFFSIFIVAFFCCWLGFYFYWKHKVKAINLLLHKKR